MYSDPPSGLSDVVERIHFAFLLPSDFLFANLSLSARRKPYSNFPNARAGGPTLHLQCRSFQMSSAFHNSSPIIHSSLTTIGPMETTGSVLSLWRRFSYLIPPPASKSSNLLIISNPSRLVAAEAEARSFSGFSLSRLLRFVSLLLYTIVQIPPERSRF